MSQMRASLSAIFEVSVKDQFRTISMIAPIGMYSYLIEHAFSSIFMFAPMRLQTARQINNTITVFYKLEVHDVCFVSQNSKIIQKLLTIINFDRRIMVDSRNRPSAGERASAEQAPPFTFQLYVGA